MATVSVKWEGNMNFRGYDADGREILMDAAAVYGGLDNGIRPMQLLLITLGGCAAIEIGNVLNKMRIPYEQFDVQVEGERAETVPQVFTRMAVKFLVKSPELSKEKMDKAIKMGGSYCSVANMLKKSCPVEYSYNLNGTEYRYTEEA